MEESWEIETTIAAIIAFHPQLDKEDLNRMEPIFQRAANIVANSWEPYEDLLATFLLEYQRLWAQTDNSNTGFLRNMFTRLEERLKGIDENRGAYDERSFKRLADWKPGYSNATCFTPIQHLWLSVIRKIKGGNSFPYFLLPPIPRHTYRLPNWYAGLPYIRKQKRNPVHGISNWLLPDVPWKTKKKPSSPPGNCCKMNTCISLFLLDENTQPEPPYNHPTAWVAAGLVKSTGNGI